MTSIYLLILGIVGLDLAFALFLLLIDHIKENGKN